MLLDIGYCALSFHPHMLSPEDPSLPVWKVKLFWLPLLALRWNLLCWFVIYLLKAEWIWGNFIGIYDIRTKSSISLISPKSQFCFAGTRSWGRRSDHQSLKVLSTTQSHGMSNIYIHIWNQYNSQSWNLSLPRQCKNFASGVNFSRNNAIYNRNESTKYILSWFYILNCWPNN